MMERVERITERICGSRNCSISETIELLPEAAMKMMVNICLNISSIGISICSKKRALLNRLIFAKFCKRAWYRSLPGKDFKKVAVSSNFLAIDRIANQWRDV